MTAEDIYELFQLNVNETFELEGKGGFFIFRPEGIGLEVQLFEKNGVLALAEIGFYMMQHPISIKKCRIFTKREAEDAELLNCTVEDSATIVKNSGGCFLNSDTRSIMLNRDFPSIQDGESWSLEYICTHAE